MSKFKKPSPARIAVAAAMRASGESWEQIGEAIGRSPGRVRRWPRWYPEEWSRHYRAAETHLLADTASEARQRLRVLMRSKAEPVQLAAALGVLKVRHAEREREYRLDPPATPPGVDPALLQFVQHVQQLSDEEKAALEAKLDQRCDGAAALDPPGAA